MLGALYPLALVRVLRNCTIGLFSSLAPSELVYEALHHAIRSSVAAMAPCEPHHLFQKVKERCRASSLFFFAVPTDGDVFVQTCRRETAAQQTT